MILLMGDVCSAVNARRTITSITRTSTTNVGDINNSHGEPWERSGRRRLRIPWSNCPCGYPLGYS